MEAAWWAIKANDEAVLTPTLVSVSRSAAGALKILAAGVLGQQMWVCCAQHPMSCDRGD